MSDVGKYHEEVLASVREASRYGRAIDILGEVRPDQADAVWQRVNAHMQKDRGSEMLYFGVLFPTLRSVVKEGFSFYGLPADQVLHIWDEIWKTSPYGEVLFAALEYYAHRVRKAPHPALWPVMRTWVDRVDNWCHADVLSGVYSWLLAADEKEVYPQLQAWNRSEELWRRRISIVSLIHYSGKNAAFMPLEKVLPLVDNCIPDHRYYIEKAVGWVLREMGHRYPDEVRAYLETNAAAMSYAAFARSIERRPAAEKAALRKLRKAAIST